MIETTKAELAAFNILEANAVKHQQILTEAIAARDAYVKLLEHKYKAVLNKDTGILEPKKKEKTK